MEFENLEIMGTIQEWFEGKDYETGLALLARYSKNRTLIQSLGRKKNQGKLEYELRKLSESGLSRLSRLSRGADVVMSRCADVVMSQCADVKIDRGELHEQEKEITNYELRITKNPEELTPRKRKLWDENRGFYKLIRSLHEKLKLMMKAPQKDREVLTRQIAQMDDKIRGNWEVIDGPEEENAEGIREKGEGRMIDHKRINANRKFISVNLKALGNVAEPEKVEEITVKLRDRYRELISAGEELKSETIEELNKYGVII